MRHAGFGLQQKEKSLPKHHGCLQAGSLVTPHRAQLLPKVKQQMCFLLVITELNGYLLPISVAVFQFCQDFVSVGEDVLYVKRGLYSSCLD